MEVDGVEAWLRGIVTRVMHSKGSFTVMFGDEDDGDVVKARFWGAGRE